MYWKEGAKRLTHHYMKFVLVHILYHQPDKDV